MSQVASLQGVRQVQAAFEAFLDILKAQMNNRLVLDDGSADEAHHYVRAAATHLLALGRPPSVVLSPSLTHNGLLSGTAKGLQHKRTLDYDFLALVGTVLEDKDNRGCILSRTVIVSDAASYGC